MEFKTPLKNHKEEKIVIPASPFLKKIGYGTGIAVYEFQRSPLREKTRSPWAVKKLLKNFKHNKNINQRLKSEASTLLKLSHKNIVGFRAFIEQNGNSMLAMEECSQCLGDMIEERFESTEQPFPVVQIKRVASDIADALKYLHNEALLLHCDVKSYNVLIKGDFEICKLCDFGVCLPLDSQGNLDKQKVDESVEYTGTVVWSPPEILQSPQVITSKADIYSYGLVIWEMIALMPPITDEASNNSLELADADLPVVRKRPDLPSDIELSVDYDPVLELFFICTEEDFEKRPSATAVCQIISDLF